MSLFDLVANSSTLGAQEKVILLTKAHTVELETERLKGEAAAERLKGELLRSQLKEAVTEGARVTGRLSVRGTIGASLSGVLQAEAWLRTPVVLMQPGTLPLTLVTPLLRRDD